MVYLTSYEDFFNSLNDFISSYDGFVIYVNDIKKLSQNPNIRDLEVNYNESGNYDFYTIEFALMYCILIKWSKIIVQIMRKKNFNRY